jgi:dTDP-4-dehydrorhamnose 3,5-epimerase
VRAERLAIPDIVKFIPEIYRDERGYFFESHRTKEILGDSDVNFVQGNVSSSLAFTLRGLHYQLRDPQGKFVRCISGAIYDVAVDVRVGSPTFGKWCGAILDDSEHAALWVPPGFAHGFLSLSRPVLVSYECTSYYVEEFARAIRWNDDTLGIPWPLQGRNPILSGKDRSAPSFFDAEKVIL